MSPVVPITAEIISADLAARALRTSFLRSWYFEIFVLSASFISKSLGTVISSI